MHEVSVLPYQQNYITSVLSYQQNYITTLNTVKTKIFLFNPCPAE